MTETKRPLFRPEAVEHHMRGRVTGRVLDLREGRTAWVFRGVLIALAVAVLLAATIRVDGSVTTQAVVGPDGRTVVVILSREPRTVVVSAEFGGRPVETAIELDGQEVQLTLAESFPPETRGTVRVDSGDASILRLLLGWD